MTANDTKNEKHGQKAPEAGGTLDIYHFKSRLDMLLAASFIIIVLLVLLLLTLWSGDSQAAVF
ncbi:MAG: hypothetical protein KDJ15_00490 [Alphaproteobacteria bacterium]|nr:hypothetical protein [Alphaproteobacteria bacterium]